MWKASEVTDNGSRIPGGGSRSPKHGWSVWGWIEGALLMCGLALLGIYGVARLESILSSKAALKSFAALESPDSSAVESHEGDSNPAEADFSTWDGDRFRAYRETLTNQFGAPLAVLHIPKIHLAVPLLDGTDDLTLNHAVGRIAGTTWPGQKGNIGIAGHRDGFFRGLEKVRVGDTIELKTKQGKDSYVVDQIHIVEPDNVSVLRPRPIPSLTLVTCYPFYFIGSAPQRYIVMASLTHEKSSGPGSSTPGSEPLTSSTNKEEQ